MPSVVGSGSICAEYLQSDLAVKVFAEKTGIAVEKLDRIKPTDYGLS